MFYHFLKYSMILDLVFVWLSFYFYYLFQHQDYVDAYLRLAAIAKARNNLQLSIELVVITPHNISASVSYTCRCMFDDHMLYFAHRSMRLWRWMASTRMHYLCLVTWSLKMMTGSRQKKHSELPVMQLMGRILMLLSLWCIYFSSLEFFQLFFTHLGIIFISSHSYCPVSPSRCFCWV